MYLTVQQWKGNKLNPVELGWHVKENMVPVKQINQWFRRAFLNLRRVVAEVVVAKHVDAGNSDYIVLLCGVSVKVKLVKTLQLLAMKIRSNNIFNDRPTRFYTKRMALLLNCIFSML